VSGSWAGEMVGELYQDHGRWRWWVNFVKFVVGCEGERTEPGSWAGVMVGEL
jgi:hypothetical protein